MLVVELKEPQRRSFAGGRYVLPALRVISLNSVFIRTTLTNQNLLRKVADFPADVLSIVQWWVKWLRSFKSTTFHSSLRIRLTPWIGSCAEEFELI